MSGGKRIASKTRIIAVALILLLVISMVVLILEMKDFQFFLNSSSTNTTATPTSIQTSPSNQPPPTPIGTTTYPTPPNQTNAPTPWQIQPGQLNITSLTCSPSAINAGQQTTIIVELKNKAQQTASILLTVEIHEPDGTSMQNTPTTQGVAVPANGVQLVMVPLATLPNETLGVHQVSASVYDLSHTTEYCSTGFNYSFNIIPSVSTIQINLSPLSVPTQITVDGAPYSAPANFTWYPGTTHTLTVPKTVPIDAKTSWSFVTWSDGNTENTRVYRTTNLPTLTAVYALTTHT